jgi:ABC-type glycerol-3-phosphate transport system substrate-binding protein
MKWQTIVVTVVALGLIVACASQATPVSEPTPTSPPPSPTAEIAAAPIEVNVGASVLLGEDEAAKALLREQVALFEKSHPHIKINLVRWGWDAKAFPEQLASGDVPDVMEIAATESALVIDNGYGADLTAFMEEWPLSRDFNERILSTFVREDRVYAVPHIVYIMGLFYDKTLFTEAGLVDQDGEAVPPTNWDEFVAAAKAVKENTSAAGFCILTQHNQGGWNFMNWGWQAGGTFERQVGGQWQATFDEAPIVEAMNFIKQLRWEHDVLQEDLVLDAGGLFEKLANRECGMAFIAPDWFQIIGGNPDDYGLTKLPTGPGGDANLMGGAFNIIKADLPAEVQQAAFEWITWYGFSPEALEYDLKSFEGKNRWIYVNRSLMYKPNSQVSIQERELLDKYRGLPYYKDYVEAAGKYARIEPPIAIQELYAALDEVLWQVLNEKNADPQTLLTEAAEKFQAEYLDTE